jgi:hypothetical protein
MHGCSFDGFCIFSSIGWQALVVSPRMVGYEVQSQLLIRQETVVSPRKKEYTSCQGKTGHGQRFKNHATL